MKFSLKTSLTISTTVAIFIILKNANDCYGQPVVTIQQTKIVGIHMITRNDRNVSGFMGIPYAEPPIGRLRFRNPIFKKLSKKTLVANKEGNTCPQVTEDSKMKVIGDEDCLVLNVYTPWLSFNQKNPLLPVMVLIYGSSYVHGNSGAEELGPGYLLDTDIIYVSFNYRLGILGFLTTGDSEALGNFGLKDQVVALQWVQKYIRHFGGDPKQVTLVGYSTGAASVNFHTFTNITKGLFHRYIMESGTSFSPRSFRERKKNSQLAKTAAELFGCPSTNSRSLVNCLRNIDAKSITNNTSIFHSIECFLQSTWLPTNEAKVKGAYITENPYDLLKKKKMRDLPWISGIVRDEGLLWMSQLYVKLTLYDKIIENLDRFLTDIFDNFVMPKNISLVVSEIKQFYFKNKVSRDKNVVIKQLSDFAGDLFKNYPAIFLANQHAENSRGPLYFYIFNYRGVLSNTNRKTHTNFNIGVTHGDELFYLYPHKPKVPVKFNEALIKKDSIMTDIMVDLWTSFVIDGVPISHKLSGNPDLWKPYLPGTNILEIGNFSNTKTKVIHSLFEERMKFWKYHFPRFTKN